MAGSDDVGTAKNEAELSYNDPNVTLPTLDSPSVPRMGLLRCTRGAWGRTQPWRLGVTAGQSAALPSACEWGCARGIPPPLESPPGPWTPFTILKRQSPPVGGGGMVF